MDITVKMARFQIKQSVLIGNTTLEISKSEKIPNFQKFSKLQIFLEASHSIVTYCVYVDSISNIKIKEIRSIMEMN